MKIRHKIWNSFCGRSFVILFLSGVLLMGVFYQVSAAPSFQSSDDGQDIFEVMCVSCHSVGGGVIVGPDLKGVLERRDRNWVRGFISMPDQILASDDPIAMDMLIEFNNIPMPNLGLTETDVEALLAFLEGGESVAPVVVDLPAGDFDQGEAIFTGGKVLTEGGTPCIACHSVGTFSALGGGNLGPDLTHVYDRFGKVGLVSAIQNIAFPTMQGVYEGKDLTDQEIADLLAFFTTVDVEGVEKNTSALFWIVGLLGAGALFGIMAYYWPRQRETLSDRLRKDAGITSRRHS
ncbi:MAG: c-type cytochrome [Anaerolineae bacterium]|nr:c-type cytochrome [Anaerolineae bacterium]